MHVVAKIKTSPAILNDPNAFIDGRARRALATRQRLLDAMAALILAGRFPTGDMVARQAGVTTRTMFLHFDDMASLFEEVYGLITAQVVARQPGVDEGTSFEQRLHRYVVMRGQLAEHFGHFSRIAAVMFHHVPRIQALLAANRRTLRDTTRAFFAPEFAGLGRDEALAMAGMLVAATTWESWIILRETFCHSIEGAERAFENVVRGLLTVAAAPSVTSAHAAAMPHPDPAHHDRARVLPFRRREEAMPERGLATRLGWSGITGR